METDEPDAVSAADEEVWELRAQLASRVLSARGLDKEWERAEKATRGAELRAEVAESAAAFTAKCASDRRRQTERSDFVGRIAERPTSALRLSAPSRADAPEVKRREEGKLRRFQERAEELRREVEAEAAALLREEHRARDASQERKEELSQLQRRFRSDADRTAERKQLQLLTERACKIGSERAVVRRRAQAAERQCMQNHDPTVTQNVVPAGWGPPSGERAAVVCADVPIVTSPDVDRDSAREAGRLMRRTVKVCGGVVLRPGPDAVSDRKEAAIVAAFDNVAAATQWTMLAARTLRGHGWPPHLVRRCSDPNVEASPGLDDLLRGPLMRSGIGIGGALALETATPGAPPTDAARHAMKARPGECMLAPSAASSLGKLNSQGGRLLRGVKLFQRQKVRGCLPVEDEGRNAAWDALETRPAIPAPAGWSAPADADADALPSRGRQSKKKEMSSACRRALRSVSGMEMRLMAEEDLTLRQPAPVGQVTLCFTDVQGSTSLWDSDAHAMRAALRTHNHLLRELISKHRGYEVRTEGDAFMVAFSEATNALAWCMEAQRRLMTLQWPQATVQHPDATTVYDADGPLFHGLRVRMGFNCCQPTCERDPNSGRMDYHGRDVHLAAKVAGQGRGGETVIGSSAFAALRKVDALPHPDIALASKGTRALQGIQREETMFQLVPSECMGRRLVWASEKNSGEEVTVWSRALGNRLVVKHKRSGRRDSGPLTPRRRQRLLMVERNAPVLFKRMRTLRRIIEAREQQSMTSVDDSGIEVPPTGRITLAFTDIAGSTALWEHDTQAMRQAHKDHNALLRRLISSHRGYEVKTEGDAFMVSFWTPKEALQWCMDAQLALYMLPIGGALPEHRSAQPADSPEGRPLFRGLRVRMGFNTGEPDCQRDPVTGRMDYFGPMVNLAARVSGVGEGGEVVMGFAAYSALLREDDETDGEVFAGLRVWSKGPLELKGIATREPIHTVLPTRFARRWEFWQEKARQQRDKQATSVVTSAFLQNHSRELTQRIKDLQQRDDEFLRKEQRKHELAGMQQDVSAKIQQLHQSLDRCDRMDPSEFGPGRMWVDGDVLPGTRHLREIHQDLGNLVRFCNVLVEGLLPAQLPTKGGRKEKKDNDKKRKEKDDGESETGSPQQFALKRRPSVPPTLSTERMVDFLRGVYLELISGGQRRGSVAVSPRRGSVSSPRRGSIQHPRRGSLAALESGQPSRPTAGWRSGFLRSSFLSGPAAVSSGVVHQHFNDIQRVGSGVLDPSQAQPGSGVLSARSSLGAGPSAGIASPRRAREQVPDGALRLNAAYEGATATRLFNEFEALGHRPGKDKPKELHLKDVLSGESAARFLGGYAVDEKLFRRLDKERKGQVAFADVLNLFFASVPEMEMMRFHNLSIPGRKLGDRDAGGIGSFRGRAKSGEGSTRAPIRLGGGGGATRVATAVTLPGVVILDSPKAAASPKPTFPPAPEEPADPPSQA